MNGPLPHRSQTLLIIIPNVLNPLLKIKSLELFKKIYRIRITFMVIIRNEDPSRMQKEMKYFS